MKIYTRGGDKGKTRLIGGSQVPKSSPRLEAYGDLDELGACLGLVVAELENNSKAQDLRLQLQEIQNQLFFIGSLFACEDPEAAKMLPHLEPDAVTRLEKQIDIWTADLPALKNFILSGGTKAAAGLHLARTICRRAERASVVMLESESFAGDLATSTSQALIYINRLSDYLFTAARYANYLDGREDVIWRK